MQLCDFSNDIVHFSKYYFFIALFLYFEHLFNRKIFLFRKIYEITKHLQEKEIPHNLIFIKCEPFESDTFEKICQTTVKAIIFPKKPSYGKAV